MTFLKFRTSRGQSTWVFECAVGRPYAIKKSPSDAYDTERWVRAAAGPTYATHVDSVVPKTTLLLVPIPGRVAAREWGVVTTCLHALLPAPKRCVERVPMTLRTICTIGIAIIVDTALTWAAQRGHAEMPPEH